MSEFWLCAISCESIEFDEIDFDKIQVRTITNYFPLIFNFNWVMTLDWYQNFFSIQYFENKLMDFDDQINGFWWNFVYTVLLARSRWECKLIIYRVLSPDVKIMLQPNVWKQMRIATNVCQISTELRPWSYAWNLKLLYTYMALKAETCATTKLSTLVDWWSIM